MPARYRLNRVGLKTEPYVRPKYEWRIKRRPLEFNNINLLLRNKDQIHR